MVRKFNHILVLTGLVLFMSCQSNSSSSSSSSEDSISAVAEDTLSSSSANTDDQDSKITNQENAASDGDYDSKTTNPETAEKLKAFLTKKLGDDLKTLEPNDRKFSFYEIDLNNDNKPEYFIRLNGSYFCGSGGCSFYLLNNDLTKNSYFTVSNPPFYRSSIVTNGWNDLIMQGKRGDDGGVISFIHLKFDKAKGKYPENPSVVKQIEMAPSGSDYIMWDENFSKAKIFEF